MVGVEIPLSKGMVAIVDAEDAELVGGKRWYAATIGNTDYAMRREAGRTIYMHREIMGDPPGLTVDHRDRNGLNNRRSNLRSCSKRLNVANSRRLKSNTTGFRGAYYGKRAGNWWSEIRSEGKTKRYLGSFPDAIGAALAYDRAAAEEYGEFAPLNFPELIGRH